MTNNTGQGGRYQMIDGVRTLIEEPTKPHPESAAPRDAKDKRLDRHEADPAPKPKTKGKT